MMMAQAGLQIAVMKEDERLESYEQLKIRSDDVYRRFSADVDEIKKDVMRTGQGKSFLSTQSGKAQVRKKERRKKERKEKEDEGKKREGEIKKEGGSQCTFKN